jgi:four helix bundle protein
MGIALREARETHLRLRLLIPARAIPAEQLDPLVQEAEEIKRVLGAIIVSTKHSSA